MQPGSYLWYNLASGEVEPVCYVGGVMRRFFSKAGAGKKKGRVKVTLSIGPVPGTEGGEPKVIITALNEGEKPVILTGPGIRLPKKRHIILPLPVGRVRFPCELQPGEDCCVWIDLKALVQQMYSRGMTDSCDIVGFYSSGFALSATSYDSDPLRFNAGEWLGPRA